MKVTFKGKPLIPSKYLEAADLQGKRVPVIIESVGEKAKLKSDKGDDEVKPLFRLRDKEKGWVLNTTNLESIAEVYGYEADAWVGKVVVIYAAKVKAFGETWMAIRVDEEATRQMAERQRNAQKGAPKQSAKPVEEPAHDPTTGEVEKSETFDEAYLREQQQSAAAEMDSEAQP